MTLWRRGVQIEILRILVGSSSHTSSLGSNILQMSSQTLNNHDVNDYPYQSYGSQGSRPFNLVATPENSSVSVADSEFDKSRSRSGGDDLDADKVSLRLTDVVVFVAVTMRGKEIVQPNTNSLNALENQLSIVASEAKNDVSRVLGRRFELDGSSRVKSSAVQSNMFREAQVGKPLVCVSQSSKSGTDYDAFTRYYELCARNVNQPSPEKNTLCESTIIGHDFRCSYFTSVVNELTTFRTFLIGELLSPCADDVPTRAIPTEDTSCVDVSTLSRLKGTRYETKPSLPVAS
nr:WRKY DNA-binding protein 33 [Tanacetum cinerariifolium]